MPLKENGVELSELYALKKQVEDLKDALYDARKQLKNAIPIPEGVTNGDVIRTMFPTDYAHIYDRSVSSWWNASYKGNQIKNNKKTT